MKISRSPRLFTSAQQPGFFAQTEQTRMFMSEDKVYRHQLEKWWDDTLPRVCFILLNPSTATNVTDDNTTNKLREYARLWGFGGYILQNIFDIRGTDPQILYTDPKPCSDVNDDYITDAVERSKAVVCGWGNHGVHLHRGASVRNLVFAMCATRHQPVHCFRITKLGQPQHPLYLKQDFQIIVWNRSKL